MVAAIRLRQTQGGDELTAQDWECLRTSPEFAELREVIQIQYFRRTAIQRTLSRIADEVRAPIDPRSDEKKLDEWKRTVEAGGAAGKHHRAVPDPENLGTAYPIHDYDPFSAKALRS